MNDPAPRVSVLIITCNQEPYIEQAVRSALMQETSFACEIVIGEDCSTDRTRAILARLDAKHPGRLRLLFRDANLGMMRNFMETYAACRGEHIALLEGDDYWAHPQKLQRQVEALDQHPEWSACYHPVPHVNRHGEPIGWAHPQHPVERVTPRDLFEQNLIQTCSVVLRRQRVPAIPEWFSGLKLGDWPLFILLAETGPIGFLPEPMACYRQHPASSWSSRPPSECLYDILEMFWALAENGKSAARPDLDRAGRALLLRELARAEERYLPQLNAARAELEVAKKRMAALDNALSLRLARCLGRPFAGLLHVLSRGRRHAAKRKGP